MTTWDDKNIRTVEDVAKNFDSDLDPKRRIKIGSLGIFADSIEDLQTFFIEGRNTYRLKDYRLEYKSHFQCDNEGWDGWYKYFYVL